VPCARNSTTHAEQLADLLSHVRAESGDALSRAKARGADRHAFRHPTQGADGSSESVLGRDQNPPVVRRRCAARPAIPAGTTIAVNTTRAVAMSGWGAWLMIGFSNTIATATIANT
jgi:hypothetical protein